MRASSLVTIQPVRPYGPAADIDSPHTLLSDCRAYSMVLLRVGRAYCGAEAERHLFEHGQRNFTLRAEGILALVIPISDASDLCGVSYFSTGLDETRQLMAEDPAVKAGVFTFELHPVHMLPGERLAS